MDGSNVSTPDASKQGGRYRIQAPLKVRQSWVRRNMRAVTFFVFVLLPTAAVAIYYFGFAASEYVSEARFVVRGPTAQAQGMLSTLLQSTGMTRAQEDTYAVQDYIMSRDAMNSLIKNDDLKAVFSRPEADWFTRFPMFSFQDTLEHFFRYYQHHVDVVMDSTTGVSTITVRTFWPTDSERIASALLLSGEQLINAMNSRQRENALRDARKEVDTAEARLLDIVSRISEFRNREALLDPTKQSVPILAGINDLQTMLSRTNLQISQLAVSTPRSPLIPDLRRRVDALQDQIDIAEAKVTGKDSSLVPKIAAFDMLEMQRQFADKQLSSATISLEASRLQSERQQIYLETIVMPHVSDYPAYPKRFTSISIAFGSFLGAYIMISLLISGAREHRII